MNKKCSTCHQVKPAEDFYASSQKKDGRLDSCKTCRKAYERERHAKGAYKVKDAHTIKNSEKIKWNGEADLANRVFGERYGIDWEYVSKQSPNIKVNGVVINVGEDIEHSTKPMTTEKKKENLYLKK